MRNVDLRICRPNTIEDFNFKLNNDTILIPASQVRAILVLRESLRETCSLKIHAILILRSFRPSIGLKNAKDIVEYLFSEYPEHYNTYECNPTEQDNISQS